MPGPKIDRNVRRALRRLPKQAGVQGDILNGHLHTLTDLIIDISKDWLGYLIKNIGAAVDNNDAVRKIQAILQAVFTTHGDILYRGVTEAARLAPAEGAGLWVLASDGPGFPPKWVNIIPEIIYITDGINRIIILPPISIPVPTFAMSAVASPGGGVVATGAFTIPVPTVSVSAVAASAAPSSITPSFTIPVPDVTVATALLSPGALGGAVADDGGVQTDETAAANNATTNDMNLLPVVPATNDAYYFGKSTLWDWLSLNIGQNGQGTWTVVWEYYNGTTWGSLSNVYDTSSGFRYVGYQSVTFLRPTDWALGTVAGIANLYWIRARVSSFTSSGAQALGTQAWIGIH